MATLANVVAKIDEQISKLNIVITNAQNDIDALQNVKTKIQNNPAMLDEFVAAYKLFSRHMPGLS